MKNFVEPLREYPIKIINFEKKKIIPLTKEDINYRIITHYCSILLIKET